MSILVQFTQHVSSLQDGMIYQVYRSARFCNRVYKVHHYSFITA